MLSFSLVAALALSATPVTASPTPQPAATATPAAPVAEAVKPVRVGTTAVMIMRLPFGKLSIADRAAVVQSRLDQVLLHHPYLTFKDVKLLLDAGKPTIYWGQFPITEVDDAHARANNFSSADLLAHAWANNLRSALKAFFAAKRLPERALYREKDNDYVYKRTEKTFAKPEDLRNTRFIFAPEDLEWGAGIKAAGQHGFVIFVKKTPETPPHAVYLGNSNGTFTEYEWIRPEDTP